MTEFVHKDDALNFALLAFVVGIFGGITSLIVTFISRKMDAISGGVVSTIPSTIIPASIGFVVANLHVDVVESLYAIPSGILLNAIFLFIWRKFPAYLATSYSNPPIKKILAITIMTSVTAWLFAAVALFFLLDGIPLFGKRIVAAISAFLMLVFGLFITKFQAIPAAYNQCSVNHKKLYVVLGIFSTIVIGLSAVISIFNEVAGGLVASFPCVFMISMISYWEYQSSTTKWKIASTTTSKVYISPHILGSLSISAYCITFGTMYEYKLFWESIGLAFSTAIYVVLSILMSIIFISLPVVMLLRLMKRKAEGNLGLVDLSSEEHAPLVSTRSEEEPWMF